MSSQRAPFVRDGEPKVGVYICHCGGNISDHVDVEKLEASAAALPGVAVARRNTFMCSDPGQEMIMEDLREGRVNRVVVASCAPSLHETTFRGAIVRAGGNPYLYEHANIREQVSWVHHGDGATDKAAVLIAAAVAKARNLEALEPLRLESVRRAAVIGGGVAGLKAAGELSRRGIQVTLIEKTPFLGGNAAQLDLLFPTEEKAGELIESLCEEILDDPNVHLLTCAEAAGFEGYVGRFRLAVKRRPPEGNDALEKLGRVRQVGLKRFVPFFGVLPTEVPEREETIQVECGAVVLATGFRHYVPLKGEYGYIDFPEVVTLPDLIKIMSEGGKGPALKVNGRSVRSVAVIHCVGSRHIPGLCEPPEGGRLNEYCSRTCCTAALQAAAEIRKRHPDTIVYDLYRDIRTYGRGHEEYYLDASRRGVRFLRFTPERPPLVGPCEDGAGKLCVTAADVLIGGEEVEMPVDLVVLSVGMQPGEASSLKEMMKLPTGSDGFLLEVHPKLRPVEVASGGIFLAGTVQAPMDVTEAAAAASAAAVKASSLLYREYVELDPFVARVRADRCTGCGECVKACLQEGALVLKDAGNGEAEAEVVPALCRGCGVCAAACSEEAIEVCGWTLEQYEAMVDAIVGGPAMGGEQGLEGGL